MVLEGRAPRARVGEAPDPPGMEDVGAENFDVYFQGMSFEL